MRLEIDPWVLAQALAVSIGRRAAGRDLPHAEAAAPPPGRRAAPGMRRVRAGAAAAHRLPGSACRPPPPALELAPATARAADFARALAPRSFHFPEDHGPHPEFQTEWWYWTGQPRRGGRPPLRLPAHLLPPRPAPGAAAGGWAGHEPDLPGPLRGHRRRRRASTPRRALGARRGGPGGSPGERRSRCGCEDWRVDGLDELRARGAPAGPRRRAACST